MQVFAWGCGSCLGCGSAEATALRPRVVEDLNSVRVVDVACGDSHCVALSAGPSLLMLSLRGVFRNTRS